MIIKRQRLEKELRAAGCELVRHGANHDVWRTPRTGEQTALPRHATLQPTLCKTIRKQLGLEPR